MAEPPLKRPRSAGEDGFRDKVALVTGATSGIGRCTARSLASAGCRVFVTARDKARLDLLVEEVRADNGRISSFPGDMTIERDVKAVMQACVDEHGQLDILVNSAGVMQGGAIDTVGVDNFDYNMNVNARGVFMCMASAAEHLKASKGCIVNVSSIAAERSFAGSLSYCASKAAVDMMTSCAALDLAKFGVRVNAVNPGVVTTELHARAGMSEEAYASFTKRSIEVTHPLGVALGRVATVDDVAHSILFLADSTKSAFSTGTTLRIDGGRGCLGAR